MDTPVRATVATILAIETTMNGEETQAGAPAFKGAMQGINPSNKNVLRVEVGAGALRGSANEAAVETRRIGRSSSGGQNATMMITMMIGEWGNVIGARTRGLIINGLVLHPGAPKLFVD